MTVFGRSTALVAALVPCVMFSFSPGVAHAAAAPATGVELSQRCTIVGKSDAASVLGFDVQTSDPSTQSAGICAFPTRSVSEEGVVSYSIVTTADVIARAAYFRFLTVKCGNVDERAPNAAQCATFRKLAFATTAAEYYADRTSTKDAMPQTGLGDVAVATATALFVLRGDEVFECVVRRSEFLDVERTIALAKLLLGRVTPIDAPPAPAASKSP